MDGGPPVSEAAESHAAVLTMSERPLTGGARVRWTGRNDGDMSGTGPAVERRRRAVVDLRWTVLRQVHGHAVRVVRFPGADTGAEADAAVTTVAGAALAVLTADCAPVALTSEEGVIAVAHAGWRGLAAGVLEATVASMKEQGARRVDAVVGPCIRAACYSFGADDLDDVVAATGPEVRGRDREGRPALDLAAGVVGALQRAGVAHIDDVGVCTACSGDLWSWRARTERSRQATVVWRP